MASSTALGGRSSTDETLADDVTKEDETVVDSEQGSSMFSIAGQEGISASK
jgi:hypothetical protein